MELGGAGFLCGQHENRDAARAHVHPDAAADLVAEDAREVIVDDHGIREDALVESFDRAFRRGRAGDVAPFAFQHQLELQRLGIRVLHDENPAGAAHRTSSAAAASSSTRGAISCSGRHSQAAPRSTAALGMP